MIKRSSLSTHFLLFEDDVHRKSLTVDQVGACALLETENTPFHLSIEYQGNPGFYTHTTLCEICFHTDSVVTWGVDKELYLFLPSLNIELTLFGFSDEETEVIRRVSTGKKKKKKTAYVGLRWT